MTAYYIVDFGSVSTAHDFVNAIADLGHRAAGVGSRVRIAGATIASLRQQPPGTDTAVRDEPWTIPGRSDEGSMPYVRMGGYTYPVWAEAAGPGLRYWCSRQDSTPGRERSHSQGYGQPRLKYGCAYCRAPLLTETGQWVVFTRDPETLAYTQAVSGCRFPGQRAAERRVAAKLAAEGHSPGFVARWVAQPPRKAA